LTNGQGFDDTVQIQTHDENDQNTRCRPCQQQRKWWRPPQAVVPSLSIEAVQAKLQAGESVIVSDVREKEEYEAGHIAQAQLLPRGLLEFRIHEAIAI
jgi:hypothetical protein